MFVKNRSLLVVFFLFLSYLCHAQVSFVVESLPSSTPDQDSIFIVGNFNNWKANDAQYMLRPQLNGKYEITIKTELPTIEYKFGRGTWNKVETDEHNEHIKNRIYRAGSGHVVSITIKNWLDLGGSKQLNYNIFFLFGFACIAIFLMIYFTTINNRNKAISITFLSFNGIILASLIGEVVFNLSNLIWQSKISLIGYILLLSWGPAILLFLRAIRFKASKYPIWVYFSPAIFIGLLTLLQLANLSSLRFLATAINPYLNVGNCFETAFCMLVGLYFHIKAAQMLSFSSNENEKLKEENNFVFITFFMSAIAFVLFCTNFILQVMSVSIGFFHLETIIVIISPIVAVEFYFFWRHPFLLRNKWISPEPFEEMEMEDTSDAKASSNEVPKERSSYINLNIEDLVGKLNLLMEKQKPYTNPDLSIAELSEMLKTKSHVLSKLLNEHYNKNFRDFINEYRIEEFIKISLSESNKNFTFLALAYEVGFNSKSTFNLAFKKSKGLSPREYFKQNYNFTEE